MLMMRLGSFRAMVAKKEAHTNRNVPDVKQFQKRRPPNANENARAGSGTLDQRPSAESYSGLHQKGTVRAREL